MRESKYDFSPEELNSDVSAESCFADMTPEQVTAMFDRIKEKENYEDFLAERKMEEERSRIL